MMNNKSMDEESATWYSTYKLVTVERIFDSMGISLSQEDLHTVSTSIHSPYYQLLQVPLKNIFNGIIISQATDYREFAQKMLVDYLLSGAANLAADATKPEGTRLQLENMRTGLMESGEQFDLLQFEHYRLINESQNSLIATAQTLPEPRVLIDEQQSAWILEIIQPFLEQACGINLKIKEFRKQFYANILRSRELLESVSGYFNQFQTEAEHMEALKFDAKLGEKK
jgi:hypothetical protein